MYKNKRLLRILSKIIARQKNGPKKSPMASMMVMNKFLDYVLDTIGDNPSSVDAFYRIFHHVDYAMVKFSMKHFADFLEVWENIWNFEWPGTSCKLQIYLERIAYHLQIPALAKLCSGKKDEPLPIHKNLYFAANVRGNYKRNIHELMDIYYKLDAWYSMAVAVKKNSTSASQFIENPSPRVEARACTICFWANLFRTTLKWIRIIISF